MDWPNGEAARIIMRHYAEEVRPYAEAKGYSRAEVRETAMRAVMSIFDAAWPPEPTPEHTARSTGGASGGGTGC